MHRSLGAMSVGVLCLSAKAAGEGPDAGTDPRLVEAQAILDEAKELNEAGKYADALAAAERALAIREALLGGMHPQVAECLSFAGSVAVEAGEYKRAEPL